MGSESKKDAHLSNQGATFIRLNELERVSNNRLISIFTSKRVWKFLKKKQLTKSDLTNT